MKRFKIVTLAAVAVLGLGALGGAAVRANAGVKSAAPPAAAAVEAPEADAGMPDTDNVQQGPQNGPDKAEAGSKKAEADGPGGPNDQSGNQVEDGQPDAVE
jgi:hypothetical protein